MSRNIPTEAEPQQSDPATRTPARAEPRPDAHPPWTVDQALEQITDPDRLRALARQWRAAMLGQHELVGHVLEIADCPQCQDAADAYDDTRACEQYRAWQAQYTAALSAI